MGDVAIFKTAQHMSNRIDLTNIGEKLIAQPFAFGRTAHQTGNIDKAQAGGNAIGRLGNIGQLIKPFIRHGNITNIRFNGAERKIRRLRAGGFGQRVEQRRFANIGQADNAAFKSHFRLPALPFRCAWLPPRGSDKWRLRLLPIKAHGRIGRLENRSANRHRLWRNRPAHDY